MSTLLAHLCLYLSLCLWLHSSHVLSTNSPKDGPSVSRKAAPMSDDSTPFFIPVIESDKTPPLQQPPSQVLKKRKLHPDEQEMHSIDSLKPKVPEREKKHDGEGSKANSKLQKKEIVNPNDPAIEPYIKYYGSVISPYIKYYKYQRVYIYDTSFKQDDPQNNYLTTRIILLSNSMIPLEYVSCLCLGSEFFKGSELVALAVTCKDVYLHLKRFLGTHKKQAMLSYKFYPAYNTCAINLMARHDLIKYHTEEKAIINLISETFEEIYGWLFDETERMGVISYEYFKSNFPWGNPTYVMKGMYLSLCQTFKEHEWSREELGVLKDVHKGSLMGAVQEYLRSPNYNFIPHVDQGVDQNFYERILERMRSMKVPFYNCPLISRLLISSRDTPLKLFLFWDMFNTLWVEILSMNGRCGKGNPLPTLRQDITISYLVLDYIISVYSSQDKGSLSRLYFEMIDYIQYSFFENDRYYKPGQKKQIQINFDEYMQNIQRQINIFLTSFVFIPSLIAIRLDIQ